ncbi:glycine zipper 2TM domain-containing protein [Ideonella sp. A 288]|uniref:glycine zipper 2TM domain-containing protein n=1 Tax=Ideonella sp. A 288 TaxID=1962181 RepID=UPI001F3F279B|nr:glycine zipper 2TM domain-containing protein [Ideonella sp. A 288]
MTSPTAPAPGATITLPRAAVLGGGAAALVAVGALAGALMMKPTLAPEPAGPSVAQAAAAPQSLAAMPPSTATAAPTGPPRSDKPGPVQSSAHRAGYNTTNPTTNPAARPAGTARSPATPLDTQPAAMGPVACAECGVVESVAAVVQKGEGSGVGAVAGGVLGGVLGHQIGGGNGRKAMTVIGAVGGGLAGHEIEKRQRSTTSYRVKVRMDDGSMRTVNRSEPIASGTRVTVDGNGLHVRRDSAADAPRTMQTGGQQS